MSIDFTVLSPIQIKERKMFFFGMIIILCFAILFVAELLNEVSQENWEQALARMVDRLDKWIDMLEERK